MPNAPSRARLTNGRYQNPKTIVRTRAFFMRHGDELFRCPACYLQVSARDGRLVNHRVGTSRPYAYPCGGSRASTD